MGNFIFSTSIFFFSLKTYQDYKNSIDIARDEGRAEGRAEGEAIGEHKKAVIIAKNLLKKGMSKEEVIDATGLTEEVVGQLMKEIKQG